MTEPYAPARLRHIGRVLRTLREEANLTQSRAGRLMGRSPAYLSLVEKGRSSLHMADLKHMLDVYDVPHDAPLRAGLIALCRQQREGGWWDGYRDAASPSSRDYVSLEHHASGIFMFTTNVIPGLLQTPEYAQNIVAWNFSEPSPQTNERFVSYRMARQAALRRDDAPHIDFVIEESALLRGFGKADVLRRQLLHLLKRAQDPRIGLNVIRTDSAEHPGTGSSFTLLGIAPPATLSLIFIDHLNGRFTLEDKGEISLYSNLAEHLKRISLSQEDSCSLIEGVVSGL